MTEKEKMLAGLPYDPADHTLAADRCRAQTLCRRICLDPFGEAAARTALLKELFGSTGTDVYVEPNFRCDYGYNIHVGEGFYANYDCIMLDSAPITIGDGCRFGPRVSLITATHPVEAERRCWRDDIPYEGEYARPITIGDNCWIATNVTIIGGVTVGCGSVIGAGSVVTKDIPDWSIAAGNPCRVIRRITESDRRKLFHEEEIDEEAWEMICAQNK